MYLIRSWNGTEVFDAIIAATALTRNLTLVTNNDKDFKTIPDLFVLNPHSL